MLKQKNDELAQAHKKLEEWSNELEEEVKLQTQELKNLKTNYPYFVRSPELLVRH